MRIITLMVLIVFSCSLHAQGKFPIQVSVIPPQPFPTTREDALKFESYEFIFLINTDPANGYDVMLSGSVSSDNGINGSFDPEVSPPTEPIFLAPGEMKALSFNDLRKLYPSISESEVFYSGINRDEVIKSNQIPEGVYTICIRALDFNSTNPLSAEKPQGCSTPLIISKLEPPFLILPEDGKEFQHDYSFIEFRWLPVAGALSPIEYHLEVIRTDGADPFDLFRTGRNLFFEKSSLSSNIYILDASNLLFAPGEYAVRVTATDPNVFGMNQNLGRSDIHTFVIGDEPEDFTITYPNDGDAMNFEPFSVEWEDLGRVPRSVYFGYIYEDDGRPVDEIIEDPSLEYFGPFNGSSANLTPSEIGLDEDKNYVVVVHAHKHSRDFNPRKSAPVRFHFNTNNNSDDPVSTDCGGECVVALPRNQNASTIWEIDDEVNIGFFKLRLQEVSVSGASYSGKGLILADELITRDLEVDLVGLMINDDGTVYQGKAIATSISGIAQFDRTGRSYSEFQGLLYNGSGQGLPYSKGELLFTSAEFNATEAHANLVSALRLSGNRLQAGEALWFMENDVLINPAGFETSELKIHLGEDVVFSDNPNIEYTFKSKKASSSRTGALGSHSPINQQVTGKIKLTPLTGQNLFNSRSSTYASFDCNGSRTVSAMGEIVLQQSNGIQFANAASVTGYFYSTFSNWSSAMGTVDFNAQNRNQVLQETYTCGEGSTTRNFKVNGIPQFDFGICSAIMDHSFNESPSDLESSWTGLYVDKMRVQLPTYFQSVENKRLAARMTGLFDGSGFHSTGSSEIIGGVGKLGEWVTVITGVELEIERGVSRNAKLEGSIVFPFAYPIWTHGYDMYFHNVFGRRVVDIDIDDLAGKNFGFTPWKADLILDGSSRLRASIDNDEISVHTDFDGTLNFQRTINGIPDCDLQNIHVNGLKIGNSRNALAPGIHATSFEAPNGSYSIAGYRADVNRIYTRRKSQGAGTNTTLNIDYEFELDNLNLGFLGETTFEMESNQAVQGGVQIYSFLRAKVKEFNLEIDIPVIEASGRVGYRNENGRRQFDGNFSAKMCGVLDLNAIELQGTFGNTADYKYWAIAARGNLSTKVNLMGDLQLNSFAGGMFNNMTMRRGINTPYSFSPANNETFGIVAGIGLEHIAPGLYAGRFDLSTTFSGGSISEIELTGLGSFLYEGSVLSPQSPTLILDGSLLLNLSDSPFLEGDFNYVLNVDQPAFSLRGQSSRNGRSIGFHFGERTWYIRMGRSSAPINATLSLKSVIGSQGSFFNASAYAYFETGRNLPLNFGLSAEIDGHNEFDQELIFANRFDLDYLYRLGVSGSLGRNNTSCSGINPNSFFGLLRGEMELSADLKYWDRCDDWNPLDWDWDGDGDDGCEKWRTIFDIEAGIAGQVYGTGPSGANLTAELGFTLVKEFNFSKNLQLGTVCN